MIEQVLKEFEVGAFVSSTPVEVGLIHKTYRVETQAGTFCLQGLHPKLADDRIMQDYQAVTAFLAKQNFPAPLLVQTRDGAPAWDDPEGTRWRLTTWLPGKTYNAAKSEKMIASAASMLGRFHAQMKDFSYTFASTHPLHRTDIHLQRLQDAVKAHEGTDLLAEIEDDVASVLATLPALLLPSSLPQHVVHGDPKISNLLFDEDSLEAIGILDLDTCTRHSVLVDLGDAVRSWCRDGGEDQLRPLSLPRFEAMMFGYGQTGPKLSSEELALLPSAGRLITLELTARFLTDYLEDSYFGWDASLYPSRRAHNLARARGMLFLADDMHKQQTHIDSIVSQSFRPVDV